jgi:hypothetical protein
VQQDQKYQPLVYTKDEYQSEKITQMAATAAVQSGD